MRRTLMALWPTMLVAALLVGLIGLQWESNRLAQQAAEERAALAEADRLANTPFMDVLSLTYADGYVTTRRVIKLEKEGFPQGIVADWRVTVVRDNSRPPSCQTVPGPGVDQGWSVYDQFEATTQSLPFDVWVGDPGCYERLRDGATYNMHVSWTPRNPALAPARSSISFTIDKSAPDDR